MINDWRGSSSSFTAVSGGMSMSAVGESVVSTANALCNPTDNVPPTTAAERTLEVTLLPLMELLR